MRRLMTMRRGFAACAVATMFGLPAAWAADGTWNVAGTGDWDAPLGSSWVGNVVADGANFTANFTQPDVTTGGNIVTIGAPHTIGNLVFSDSNTGTGAADNWDVTGAGGLTLSNTTQPTITVNAMNPGGSAIINTPLIGTQGFIKAGVGQLILGSAGGAHTITGGINITGGTLRLDAAVPVQAITLQGGGTLSVPAGIGTATTGVISVAAGATGNIVTLNGGGINAVGAAGAGATLNVSTATDGATITALGNWATGTALAAVNVSGVAAGNPEFLNLSVNGGTPAFTAASLQNTALTLNDIVAFVRTNSGGNTVNFGALAGNAAAVLSGGGQSGGTVARYSIGSLNTSTEFAGNIDTTSAPVSGTNTGGMDLTKVGTGTLTLSGNLTYAPTLNATVANRGGITTVSAGTLKLTGPAAIAGGTTDGITTAVSTVRVLSGATLDVSGVTTPYSTAALQQVIGNGTIVGNYTHDEGTLAPADTISGTTPTLVNGAGTLTFANNMSFAGTGDIRFTVGTTPALGNDLIQVNGSTILTGTPTISFVSTAIPAAGNYTIVNSVGGFGGTDASGWNINWVGRGTPTLQVSGSTLQLVVPAGALPANLNWTGAVDGTWVAGVSGPLNWQNNGTNAADSYFDQDAVTFADTYGPGNTAVTNGTVTLNTTITPTSVTVNNSVVAYSITGAGQISGTSTFTKSGAGTLILQTPNNFSGAAAINGGTVDIGANNNALGTGALTMSNGTLNSTAAGVTLTNSSFVQATGTSNTINAAGGTGILTLPALSGSGQLTIATTVAGKGVDLATSNTAFTGNLVIGDPLTSVQVVTRMSGGGSSLASSTVTLNGASLRDRSTSAQTISLGALVGDSTSVLQGYQGGSGASAKTWQIGALNTTTTYAGATVDGDGSGITRALTNIIKVGTGTLRMSGALSHSGTTTVNAGTYLVNGTHLVDTYLVATKPPATPFSVGDYIVNTGGTLGGTGNIGDVLDPAAGLITINTGGKLAPGDGGVGTLTATNTNVVFGAGSTFAVEVGVGGVTDLLALSGAPLGGNLTLNASSTLSVANLGAAPFQNYVIATYTGTLTGTFGVTSGYTVDYSTPGQIILHYTAAPIAGDFDHNGAVNAADLTVWRGAYGTNSSADADNDGDSDGADFLVWQRNLGQVIPPAIGAAGAVPEPGSLALAAAALVGLVGARRRRS